MDSARHAARAAPQHLRLFSRHSCHYCNRQASHLPCHQGCAFEPNRPRRRDYDNLHQPGRGILQPARHHLCHHRGLCLSTDRPVSDSPGMSASFTASISCQYLHLLLMAKKQPLFCPSHHPPLTYESNHYPQLQIQDTSKLLSPAATLPSLLDLVASIYIFDQSPAADALRCRSHLPHAQFCCERLV